MKLDEIYGKDFAKLYAQIAHDDDNAPRKGTGQPYHVHPQGVETILEGYGVDDEKILIAAHCHDLVEDTHVGIDNIEELFGSDVAELVSELTNDSKFDGLDKETYMNRKLVNLSEDALTIKLGDMLYNLLDRPRVKQMDRMKANLDYLKHHRKITKAIHKSLIDAFYTGFSSQRRSIK